MNTTILEKVEVGDEIILKVAGVYANKEFENSVAQVINIPEKNTLYIQIIQGKDVGSKYTLTIHPNYWAYEKIIKDWDN